MCVHVGPQWTLSQLDLRPAGHYTVASAYAKDIFCLDWF